jgi:hypothetical protein
MALRCSGPLCSPGRRFEFKKEVFMRTVFIPAFSANLVLALVSLALSPPRLWRSISALGGHFRVAIGNVHGLRGLLGRENHEGFPGSPREACLTP